VLYNNIPIELQEYRQWICWRYELIIDPKTGKEKWTKIPIRAFDGYNASVTNPRDWCDFSTCVNYAVQHKVGIGFVFTKSDPYTGIDLDDPEGDAEIASNHAAMLADFNTYSEFSPSGNGVHIIAKALLNGQGRRRNKVECYDTHRFFTFTGNCFGNRNVEDRQDLVTLLHQTLAPEIKVVQGQGSPIETMTDDDVLAHARGATNSLKFNDLFTGEWLKHYETQSEADFALINMISFYSRNAIQTARIFRQSGLAMRDKAKRVNYVENMIKRSFDRMVPTVTIPESGNWFDASTVEPWEVKLSMRNIGKVSDSVWRDDPKPPAHHTLAPIHHGKQFYTTPEGDSLMEFAAPKPPMQIPGLLGQLVQHTWNSAPHQVAEVAIASAVATMALLCSRAYRHGSMGLALYVLVLAKTSTGKSFGYAANDARFQAMVNRYKSFAPPKNITGKARAELLEKMVIGEIGSAQGLAQHIPNAPSTLAQLDEYVDAIRMMANPNPPPHLAQVRSELLKLMEMSGPGRIYRGRKYSQRSSSAAESVDVISPSFSILATGTPQQFYDELSTTLLTTGFLPRFTILEYEGGLTRKNLSPQRSPDPAMIENMCALFDIYFNAAQTLVGTPDEFIDVQPRDEAATRALALFDDHCYRNVHDAHNNGSNMEGMWSRAKDNVRKIAALIAIGCSPYAPAIEAEHVAIAIAIVRPAVDRIGAKVFKGEVGFNDDRLEAEIKRVIVRLMNGGYDTAFKISNVAKRELIEAGYIQTSILRSYCMKLSAFKTHKLGSAKAFDNTYRDLLNYGIVKPYEANGLKCVLPNPDHFK
jgi:hypothetical protein